MKNNKIEGEIQRSVNLWSVFYLFSKPNLILKISSFVVITDKLKFSVYFKYIGIISVTVSNFQRFLKYILLNGGSVPPLRHTCSFEPNI
jgi:hypothetical protein